LLSLAACAALVLFALGGLTGCKKQSPPPAEPNTATETSAPGAGREQAVLDPLDAAASLFRGPSVSLQNVLKGDKPWSPAAESWWGKNVVVVIWTTWGATCKLQVPQLKELRSGYADKDLVILSVSNEPPALLKEFAEKERINYTVLSGGGGALPAPFGEVQYVPSSFFIDAQGRFKMAATGFMPVEDAKAIVQAQ
jgi:peroxiredoxin